MTSVDKQLHDAYSSILIMTSVDKHDVSRHTNMTSLDTHTHTTYFYIYIDIYPPEPSVAQKAPTKPLEAVRLQ